MKRCLLTGFIFCMGISCKKFVEIPPPINQPVSSVIFDNDAMATSAVTGIYSEMMSGANRFTAGELTFYAGMAADEIYHFNPTFREEFIRNEITVANHNLLLINFWERAYKFIYTTNLCLENLERSTSFLLPSVKQYLTGECKFIRAFCYFHLVNLFGKVPLAVSSDYEKNAVLPREDISIVYDLIVEDLKKAKELLPDEYPQQGRIRPTKMAAAALLARVHLYLQRWADAETEASIVIGSSPYLLEPELNNVFLRSSKEAIWQLMPVNPTINATFEGNQVIPSSPGNLPSYLLRDTLVKSFEPDDDRKDKWVMPRTFANQSLHYPVKYKVRTAGILTEFYMVLRLAEQYLIRAEAKARQNKLTEAAADIDRIRNRAGLPNTTAVTQQELYTAIAQERKVELFAEWGHRWYDLKRTGQANTVLGGQKTTWDATDVLWPIPFTQLQANSSWSQNQGY